MASYAPNIFQSGDGRQYALVITLSPDPDSSAEDNAVSLDALGIEEFNYTSELNSLVLTGQIIYVDKYGLVDKFLEQQYCRCDVIFAEMLADDDGSISNGQIDEENCFEHSFIVDNLKIVKRFGEQIKYQIDLVSVHWYNCISKIQFSNNDKDPQSVFDILKACMNSVNLATDDMYDAVNTEVKINYAAQANDNLFQVFNYLMDKLYFWQQKDNSLKFLVYNWYSDNYHLLDMAWSGSLMGSKSTILSFFKSNAELLAQKIPSNIGSYTNGMSKTDLYSVMFNKDVYEYDMSLNKFVNKDPVKEQSLVNFMNQRMSYDEYLSKYHKLELESTLLKFDDKKTYWSNPLDMYFKLVDIMQATGALTLNVNGDILRQCGYQETLVVDRDMNILKDDSAEELERLKTKYTGFEGPWIVSKVVSVIRPVENLFRQRIGLFRNYTVQSKIEQPVYTSPEQIKAANDAFNEEMKALDDYMAANPV